MSLEALWESLCSVHRDQKSFEIVRGVCVYVCIPNGYPWTSSWWMRASETWEYQPWLRKEVSYSLQTLMETLTHLTFLWLTNVIFMAIFCSFLFTFLTSFLLDFSLYFNLSHFLIFMSFALMNEKQDEDFNTRPYSLEWLTFGLSCGLLA